MPGSTPLEHSEEGRAFLQRRLAIAGRIGALLGGTFLVYRWVGAGSRWRDELTHPSFGFHFAGAVGMTVVWLVCRAGRRSVPTLRTVETAGLLVAATGYSLMGWSIPGWQMPHYIVLLAMQGVLVARAVYVPSSARRTLALTIAAGVPVLGATYLMYRDADVSGWVHIAPAMRALSGEDIARSITLAALIWWVVTVTICTGASNVIYGLRKSVRQARKLGQYELKAKLGEGAMGVVFRAEHAMLRRPTAVKLLPPEKAGDRSIARFEKEVRQTARLTHPNTVTIFDYGRTPDGVFYYAMELLDGPTLREVVETTGAQPASRVVRIVEQAARALAEAHDVGLVHRDIKPANIMLVTQGGERDITKVVDFGLVKELTPEPSAWATAVTTITGTPQYMSPESITTPDEVDARSDLYALGAVAYYLLAGQHVFGGTSIVEVCSHHLHTAPTPITELAPSTPADLAEIVMQCLDKDPAARPRSASRMAVALHSCGVERWTDADAAAWWQAHGDALGERALATANTAEALTLDVDFERRAAAEVGLGA